jgi:hypothetical protein
MKITNLAITTTYLLGLVLGIFIDSAEARDRTPYASRKFDAGILSSFFLVDETSNGQPIVDIKENQNIGLFPGAIIDYQAYNPAIPAGPSNQFLDPKKVDPQYIDKNKQFPLVDLEAKLIKNANIQQELGWIVSSQYTENVIAYNFLNPIDKEIIDSFYTLKDSNSSLPSNFDEDKAVNSFKYLFDNNLLELAALEGEAKNVVEGRSTFRGSGLRVEVNSVAVPEANSINPLMLFGVLGMGFYFKRKLIK